MKEKTPKQREYLLRRNLRYLYDQLRIDINKVLTELHYRPSDYEVTIRLHKKHREDK